MAVDRFTSAGAIYRGDRNVERWHTPATGGGGTSTNIDTGARSLISQILASPGITPDVEPQDGLSADGKQWQNQTLAAIPVPNPASEANMLAAGFTDVTQGGGASGLNTNGPWTGAASADDKFGLDPATGARYYVDAVGDWQPIQDIDLNTTRETVAGNAPAANTIPAQVSGQANRDTGDYHIITFDDYTVAYEFDTPPIEKGRQSNIDGGFESIELAASASLEPSPKVNWLREYVITAVAPITQETVGTVDYNVVSFPLPAPTSDGLRIDIIRESAQSPYLDGPIDGQTGLIINKDKAKVQLRSSGGTWLYST